MKPRRIVTAREQVEAWQLRELIAAEPGGHLPYQPSEFGYVWYYDGPNYVAETRDGKSEIVLTPNGGQIDWEVLDDQGVVERGNFSGMVQDLDGILYRADRLLAEFDENPVVPAKEFGYDESYSEQFPSSFPFPDFRESATVQDSDYWGVPEGTEIKPGMKPKGDKSKGEPKKDEGDESKKQDKSEDDDTTISPPEKLTDEQYAQHLDKISERLDDAIAEGLQTDVAYSVGGKAENYTPERVRQQRQIIDELWRTQGRTAPRDGKAVMAGGLGGAGKTFVLGKHAGVDKSQYLTINPDDIKELMVKQGMVPEVEGLSPMEASTLIHEESSYLAKMLANRAYEQGTNVMWDITMSSPSSVSDRLDQLEEAGYDSPEGVFVDVPVELSVKSAEDRHRRGMENYRQGIGSGGRYVPSDVIRKNKSDTYSSKNRETFENLKDRFGDTAVFDNSQRGRDPVKTQGTGRWAARRTDSRWCKIKSVPPRRPTTKGIRQ